MSVRFGRDADISQITFRIDYRRENLNGLRHVCLPSASPVDAPNAPD